MAQKGPFNDVPGFVRERGAMFGRQLVELEIKRLICPVSDEAKQEASDIEDRDCYSEHHDNPDHGNELGVPIVKLNDFTRVHILVLLLQNLACLLWVARAAPIQALFRIASGPLSYSGNRREPIDYGSCENCDSNDTVPLSGKITIVSVEKEAVESGHFEECHDHPAF